MAFVDDVKAALEQGAHAGAAALSTAGKDLTGDVERFVIPHLADIAIQIASIAEKRAAGIFTDVTTKNSTGFREGRHRGACKNGGYARRSRGAEPS